ncbi:MAG TPA: CPBP family intramembrane glutamic endopeptidase [Chthoniobacteraceae bacterium]|jgi:membrane protease YdiL (CAAX protease family)|nr:CPBP family intramembrane glutamic endopeptidase [Chthoniobacteraceae bacterium]
MTLKETDFRAAHGALFAAFLILPAAMPMLRMWPLLWLVPLICYFAVIACVPALRRTFCWLRVGRVTVATMCPAIGLGVVSCAALIVFQLSFKPDLHAYRASLPFAALGGVIVAGLVFSLLNALLEELVFRGVLFDGIDSQWGPWVAVVATAIIFGCGHAHGYPPGRFGEVLAGLYGLTLGALRVWTGGLALPFVAHIFADVTIYCIAVQRVLR